MSEIFIIKTLFLPLREMLYDDSVTLCWSVGALHAHCVSARLHPQDGALQVHPSPGQNVGSRTVLNRNCGEDKGEEMQVAVFYGQSHGKSFGDREGILLVEFLERGATVDSERYVQTSTL